MRPLIASGIRRCPECGRDLPRGVFFHIEPKPFVWYVWFAFVALAPAGVAIGAWLMLAADAWNPIRQLPTALTAGWMVLTPVYSYIVTLRFCIAHRLPRAGFGAWPACVPVMAVNFILAAAVLVRT
jgi:hypothetical protein